MQSFASFHPSSPFQSAYFLYSQLTHRAPIRLCRAPPPGAGLWSVLCGKKRVERFVAMPNKMLQRLNQTKNYLFSLASNSTPCKVQAGKRERATMKVWCLILAKGTYRERGNKQDRQLQSVRSLRLASDGRSILLREAALHNSTGQRKQQDNHCERRPYCERHLNQSLRSEM